MSDDTTDAASEQPRDPRTREVEGQSGMPGEFVDTPENLPGDQDEPGASQGPDLDHDDD